MWIKRLLKIFFLLFLLIGLLIGLFVGSVYIGIFGPLPEKKELAGITNEQASLVLASDGTLIGKFFAENRTNIKFEDVPKHLKEALISTEDKRFFEHDGIDGRSYLRVLVKTILLGDKSAGGGSTITQQLVKNLYGRDDYNFLSMPISKTREAIIANRMEEVLTKEEILLLYLNSVPFGEEVYGIEAASKRYFDKNTRDLNIQESAVLVGILKANTYYNPRLHPDNAILRRNQVLELMASEGFIGKAEKLELQDSPLGLRYTNYQLESPAGYFVYQVKKRATAILENLKSTQGADYDIGKDGLKIYTTLDIRLQKKAREATATHLAKMQPLLDEDLKQYGERKKWEAGLKKSGLPGDWDKNSKREILYQDGMQTKNISKADSLWHYYKMLQAAVLAVDPNTGAVLVWSGGNNFRYLPFDQVLSKRQVASTIKPFIYAAALEDGFEPCDYFENTVTEYEDYEGWKPENYDKSETSDMKVAMWYALSRSMNLPTVDIYFETGHDEVADVCRRLGLEAPFDETPSLALGALDASLYDMVRAYSVFANGGYLPEDFYIIEKITDADGQIIYQNEKIEKKRVLDKEVAQEITSMLQLAINEGTGTKMRNAYGIRSDLAGKTGTAQNYSDAWFMAFTPNLVIGTWVGASSPQIHFHSGLGSGSALALPIAGELISFAEKQSNLKIKYLTPFNIPVEITEELNCEPFRKKGIRGFFSRKGQETDQEDTFIEEEIEVDEAAVEEKSKIKTFFNNLFKKKEKKKKND